MWELRPKKDLEKFMQHLTPTNLKNQQNSWQFHEDLLEKTENNKVVRINDELTKLQSYVTLSSDENDLDTGLWK